ncbi:MAG: DNA repair protein RadC [Rikenellaceae bacterium]|nr:DNA repair protein RadC [Rikenellaceae bacterium]
MHLFASDNYSPYSKREDRADAPTEKQLLERMRTRGAEALADDELLSLVIRVGTPSMTALEQSRRVLETLGGTAGRVTRVSLDKLRMVEGLGIKKASLIAAAFELGRRLAERDSSTVSVITGSDEIVRMFKPKLSILSHEEFWVVFLSSANTVLDRIRISQGGVTSTTADPKIILKKAVELLASAIILVHNHPSGVCDPSPNDQLLTKKIADSAALFDISVRDHVIVTSGKCFSFNDNGLL